MGASLGAMSETKWLSGSEQYVWRSFLAATRAMFDELDRQLQRDAGMPLAYYEILVRLSEEPEWTLRMSELANRSGSSPSRLSHAVSSLERRGWVTRQRCPTDRRGLYAALTEEGYAALAAAAPGHVETVRQLLLDPLTDEQVAELGRISEALLAQAKPEGTVAATVRSP